MFKVPKEADGARSVSLTRWQTGDLLYVSRLVVRRSEVTGLGNQPIADGNRNGHASARKYVRDGRVVVERSGVEHNVSGQKLYTKGRNWPLGNEKR